MNMFISKLDEVSSKLNVEAPLSLPPLKPNLRHDPDGTMAKRLLTVMTQGQVSGTHAWRILAAYGSGIPRTNLESALNAVARYRLSTIIPGSTNDASSAAWSWARISHLLALWKGKVCGHIDQRHFVPSPAGIDAALSALILSQKEAVRVISDTFFWQALAKDLAVDRATPDAQTHPIVAMRRGPLLLHGPTGCGKTHLVSSAARLMGLPFITVDGSIIVGEGIVGVSIGESLKAITRKVEEGDKSAPFTVLFIDEVDKLLTPGKFGGSIQAELLRLLEGQPFALYSHSRESFQISAGSHCDTSQLLIVLGGAFQGLEDSWREPPKTIGFQTAEPATMTHAAGPTVEHLTREGGMGRELLGRLRHVVRMQPLNEKALMHILNSEETTPLRQVNTRLRIFGKTLQLTQQAKTLLARHAAPQALGARPLESAIARIAAPIERQLISAKPNSGETSVIRISAKMVKQCCG